jgi:hypothetical protein
VPLRIRFATPEDASILHRFICELAEYEREPDAVKVTPAELHAQLSQPRPPFECLLAERGDAPAAEALGFALFFASYSTWRGRAGLYLEDLYVPPAHRGSLVVELRASQRANFFGPALEVLHRHRGRLPAAELAVQVELVLHLLS